ncbi:MAG: hypothetical protein LLF81_13015 [Porphyromonadaceae bacterium]|nr:hypothetical protein [Porphyromonadaceae bacterium]
MRIRFTSHTDENEVEVSAAELEAIDRGLEDVKNGNVMSHSEAKKIFHDAINKVGNRAVKERSEILPRKDEIHLFCNFVEKFLNM